MVLGLVSGQEILLFATDAIAIFDKLEQCRASLITGGTEDVIAADDRRRDVRGLIGDVVIAPEEFTVTGAHADYAAADELHILFHAAGVRNNNRRVAGALLACVAS